MAICLLVLHLELVSLRSFGLNWSTTIPGPVHYWLLLAFKLRKALFSGNRDLLFAVTPVYQKVVVWKTAWNEPLSSQKLYLDQTLKNQPKIELKKAFIVWPIFKAHPESPVKSRKFQFYNPELAKVKGFIPFLFFNTIFVGFVLTPVLALMVNIQTEYGSGLKKLWLIRNFARQ